MNRGKIGKSSLKNTTNFLRVFMRYFEGKREKFEGSDYLERV